MPLICVPTVLMPVIYGALEVPNPKVQHKALKIIPTILDVIDYATVKTALFQKLEVFFHLNKKMALKVLMFCCFFVFVFVFSFCFQSYCTRSRTS